MYSGFSHFYFRVRDLDESIDFYTKNLGFRMLRKYIFNGRPNAYLGLGDTLLEVSAAQDPAALPGPNGTRVFGITVSDIDAAMAELKVKGVEVFTEPQAARTFWGRQAVIKDPSNYLIALREWRDPDNPYYDGWQPEHEDVQRLA
jgi:catechol 2,3-dioxygenase-like lactoylglutathione lyase family enzyme